MPTPAARIGSFSSLAIFAFACIFPVLLTGCCHTPTVNTNVNADGHVLTETPTPGNSGPVWGFTVPRQDACAGGPAIAVIDVDGILLNMDMTGPASAGENPVSLFRERLDTAAADPCTRAVVVRINSPGGGVTASDIMRHDLERFKETTRMPVVACLMDIGAGGGYYLATAADQIVAHPTTVTGGIGVILNLYNLAGVEEKYDIAYRPIKSGSNIDSGTILQRPQMMDDQGLAQQLKDQRDILQDIANQYQDRFKDVVLRSRPQIGQGREDLFDGRIFSGAQAVQLHLVDSLGYLDDAVEQARNMAGAPGARVVMYHRCNDRARSPYSITPNVPIQGQIMTMNLPGLDRASMPTFLYLWQPEPTMEKKLSGR
jgi:protease-4